MQVKLSNNIIKSSVTNDNFKDQLIAENLLQFFVRRAVHKITGVDTFALNSNNMFTFAAYLKTLITLKKGAPALFQFHKAGFLQRSGIQANPKIPEMTIYAFKDGSFVNLPQMVEIINTQSWGIFKNGEKISNRITIVWPGAVYYDDHSRYAMLEAAVKRGPFAHVTIIDPDMDAMLNF